MLSSARSGATRTTEPFDGVLRVTFMRRSIDDRAREGGCSMRRWLVPTVGFITVVMLGGLWTEPADAQTPGETGRISYVQDTKNGDDCIVKSVEPDGTGTVTLPGGGIGAYSPDGTHIATLYNVSDGRIATMVMDSDGANITA